MSDMRSVLGEFAEKEASASRIADAVEWIQAFRLMPRQTPLHGVSIT